MTSLVAGRTGSQVTFLIHTSIVKPHHQLYRLCKPASGGTSTQQNKDVTPDCTTPTSQIVLKDYDSLIVSSLLSFLYTSEYWPEHTLLLDHHTYLQDISLQPMNKGVSDLFTAQAITLHHFKLAMLASKFSVEPLLLLCKQKVAFTLKNLPPKELLDLVRALYSKDLSYREQFFELIIYGEIGIPCKGLDQRPSAKPKWSGLSFWTKDVLQRLMSPDSEDLRPGSPMNSTDGEVEEKATTRDKFLKMLSTQGGDLASDVVNAFWEAGLGLRLETTSPIHPTCTAVLPRENGGVLDVDGAACN